MVSPEAFDHVALKTSDIPETVAFYESTLDATILSEGALERDSWDESYEYVGIDAGGMTLYLLEKPPYEAEGIDDSLDTGFVHYGFEVEDVLDCHESMVALDVPIELEPTELGDLRVAFYRDPTGTRFELLEEL